MKIKNQKKVAAVGVGVLGNKEFVDDSNSKSQEPVSQPESVKTKQFNGQVAIITGAASGIGFAIAQRLLKEGADVALLDINETGLKTEFKKYKIKARLFPIDVTNQALVDKAVEEVVGLFGKIDILINCAGITGVVGGLSHEVSSEDLRKVFELNFMSCFYTTKAVLPHMLKMNYGRILHMASIAGKEGNARMLAYSSSKAALIGMTKVQGKEYAETGITVNAIAPAVIRTPLLDKVPEPQIKYMTDKIPMKRCGTLDEISNLAAYIVSKQNSFTTGFTFDLTGGRATY
ncbi:MAG TPA: SDR family NAD(P)-dependent oxidoreductase [Chitinophagaceae bacterium]|nr:SDR family NAD(P)-dependent oxidoreductase [Chitinophagaceae bacterium]